MKKKIFTFVMLSVLTFGFASGCTKQESAYVIDGNEVIFQIGEDYYTALDLFGEAKLSIDNMDAFYSKVKDIVIKTVAPVDQTMRNSVDVEMTAWESNVKADANTNGTSYAEAKAAALDSAGVSTTDELIEQKLLELQTQKVVEKYWKEEESNYFADYIRENMVFHISDIVVDLSVATTMDITNKTISEADALQISDIATRLVEGQEYYNVAILSDDTKNNTTGGDLGLVSLSDSSISYEIKYALLSYAMYEQQASLNVDSNSYLDTLYGSGVEAIPYTYMNMLDEYAADTSFKVDNYDYYHLRMYARSIIFNSLLNTKAFRYLVNDDVDAASATNVVSMDNVKMPETDTQGYLAASSQYVVTNSNGYPILVVRDNDGLHFISINMSPFSEDALAYYSTELDSEDGFKTYIELGITSDEKNSRTNELESFAQDYSTFAIRNSSDSYLEHDMVKKYMDEYNITVVDQELASKLELYLTSGLTYAKDIFKDDIELSLSNLSKSIETEHSEIIMKERVPLACIEDKVNCVQTYENGFVYTPGGAE